MEDTKVNKSLRKVIIRFAFIFLLIILLLTFFSRSINQMLLPQVTTYVPSDKIVSNSTMFSGSIIYENTTKAYPEFACFIDAILIEEGEDVIVGQPIAHLRDSDVASIKAQYEVDILSLENSIQSSKDQIASRYTNKTQDAALQRQIDILNIQLEEKQKEQERFLYLVDEDNNLLSTVEGTVLTLYITDRSYCNETTAIFEYINEGSYPVIRWEMPADKASLYDESSRVFIEYKYMEQSDEGSVSKSSSTNSSIDSKTYNYENNSYIYTVVVKIFKLEKAYKLDITLSNRAATLKNAVPKNAVVKDTENTGYLYLLQKDEDTGKYYANEVHISISGDTGAYYGTDYDFQKNEQIILSSTKPLSDNAEVRLR